MQIEIDSIMGPPTSEVSAKYPGVASVPIIRIFGITGNQNSVACYVHGFLPYIYVRAPSSFKKFQCEVFRETLEASLCC